MKTATAEIDIDQISRDLSQIATDVHTIKVLILGGEIDYRLASIEALASRAGALADRLIKATGSIGVRGSFEEWFED